MHRAISITTITSHPYFTRSPLLWGPPSVSSRISSAEENCSASSTNGKEASDPTGALYTWFPRFHSPHRIHHVRRFFFVRADVVVLIKWPSRLPIGTDSVTSCLDTPLYGPPLYKKLGRRSGIFFDPDEIIFIFEGEKVPPPYKHSPIRNLVGLNGPPAVLYRGGGKIQNRHPHVHMPSIINFNVIHSKFRQLVVRDRREICIFVFYGLSLPCALCKYLRIKCHPQRKHTGLQNVRHSQKLMGAEYWTQPWRKPSGSEEPGEWNF